MNREPSLPRLRRGLESGSSDAIGEFAVRCVKAGAAIHPAYRHLVYELPDSPEDTGQLFAEHVLEIGRRQGHHKLAEIVGEATSFAHLDRRLAMRARWWARDRSRGSFTYLLRVRIDDLPKRDAERFVRVQRLFVGLVAGPRTTRDLDDVVRVATMVHGTDAGRRVAEDVQSTERIGKHALRNGTAEVLRAVEAAAPPPQIADVLALLCGRGDATPAVAREAGDRGWRPSGAAGPSEGAGATDVVALGLIGLRAAGLAEDDAALAVVLDDLLAVGELRPGTAEAVRQALEGCGAPRDHYVDVLRAVRDVLDDLDDR